MAENKKLRKIYDRRSGVWYDIGGTGGAVNAGIDGNSLVIEKKSIDSDDPVADDYRYNRLLLSGDSVTTDDQFYSVNADDGVLKRVYNPSQSTFFGNAVNDVSAMLTLVDDYLKNYDQFYYDANISGKGGFVYNGTYDNPEEDTPALNGNNQKGMNCAIFTNLIMQGVPYTSSTYNKLDTSKKNKATNPVFAPMAKNALAYGLESQHTYPNLQHSGLYTWKLARYLYDMGVLRPVGNNIAGNTGLGNSVEGTYNPGDILFFASEDHLEDRFMGIQHCAVLVGYIGYSDVITNMLIAECSSPMSGSNQSTLKVRTLRATGDNIVATFSPGYNNGFNLSFMPRTLYDTDSYAYSTNLTFEKTNVACNGSSNAIDVESQFSGVMTDSFKKQHRGAYMLVVDPIYSSLIAAARWIINYTYTLDDWANTQLQSTQHSMVAAGRFILPIPYGTTVTLYTDSSYVSNANLKLNIVTSDKFLKV